MASIPVSRACQVVMRTEDSGLIKALRKGIFPTMEHREINAWYRTENPNYGGREYLSGRSWNVRQAVGLEALRIHKVLTP